MRPFPHKPAITIILACILVLAACRKDNPTPAISKPLDLPANSEAVIGAGNSFAFHFFHTDLEIAPSDKNRLISPLSIYTALSMLYNGAANATRDSIAKTLALNGISIDDLNALNKALIEQMPSVDNKVILSIANSIWYRNKGLQPRQDFLDLIKNSYQGLIQQLDFANPSSANTINSWIAKKTNNKIHKVIEEISPNEIMFLINTVYFNGPWLYSFKPSETYNDNFHLRDGSSVSVPFMTQKATIRTAHLPSFTLAELPYGTGKGYDMFLVIPDSVQQPIADFARSFNNASLTNAISQLDSQYITLIVPKWEYSYTIGDMSPHLSRLGMGIAFADGGADFSNMYQGHDPVRITRSLHKTYIKVSEEGTEAAAVTVIGVGSVSANIKLIKADHPFLYCIRDRQAGVILFMGILNNPLEKE